METEQLVPVIIAFLVAATGWLKSHTEVKAVQRASSFTQFYVECGWRTYVEELFDEILRIHACSKEVEGLAIWRTSTPNGAISSALS